jgi:hypothetical protein
VQIATGERALDGVIQGQYLVQANDLDGPDDRAGLVDNDAQCLKATLVHGFLSTVAKRTQTR